MVGLIFAMATRYLMLSIAKGAGNKVRVTFELA